ncbi:Muskelin N-terminus-domain-containing protein [Lentinula edodes]|uniref:Muskelin N-terminus-domain-containing protein n=1 Tax=Lentinula lateritia TaxID=40482 RepID=A0A9W9AYT7_9AGAR|nr:Muskelin N-terminus-domain-containing protein [Lentinula edodes]
METSSDAIEYTVHDYSSYSTHFYPENILVDDPSNSKSRWTTQQSEAVHWILLRLNKLSVLKSITFGKVSSHPCNMKEFKVYVGMTPENMTEVLHSSLKNDPIRETFSIRHHNSTGHCFPTRFVKIEPLTVFSPSYNTSIWHISLTGIINEVSVEEVKEDYDRFRETRVMQHILKHLRQRRLLTPFNSILTQSGVRLEHPLITELYESVVLTGNWDKAETVLHDMSAAGLFDQCLKSSNPRAVWREIHDTDANGDIPSVRGGHAMCIDCQRRYIYLFGGWDGQTSLADFWRYDIKEQRWVVLSANTSLESNGPGPRSCHKMVYDSKTNSIYVFGRLDDQDRPTSRAQTRNPESAGSPGFNRSSGAADETPTLSSRPMPSSEFYRYRCEDNTWEHLDIDVNGPRTIFDHQMVMDSEAQILYVFGGRAAEKDYDYSGLHSFNVRMKKWSLLQYVYLSCRTKFFIQFSLMSRATDSTIPSRFGHSMILEPTTRQLYIFAGERDEKFLSDMYIYDIATNTATEVFSDFTSSGGPQPCFTQRAVIDPTLQEIYIFGGLIHDRATLSESSNWLYRYPSRPGKWQKIQPLKGLHKNPTPSSSSSPQITANPPSRFAHQVVYDLPSKTVYLHGGTMMDSDSAKLREGNDGQTEEAPMKRLSDFWEMSLWRLSSKELIRRSAYLIRQQRFKEMCETQAPVQSLIYLQNQVSEVVNHDDPGETQLFRSLLTHLLMNSSPISTVPSAIETESPRNNYAGDAKPQTDSSLLNISTGNSSDQLGHPGLLQSGLDSAHISSEPLPDLSSQNRTDTKIQTSEDPYERKLHPTKDPMSQECFVQRTKTFEAILEFVDDDAKQPAGSLLELVDVDADLL